MHVPSPLVRSTALIMSNAFNKPRRRGKGVGRVAWLRQGGAKSSTPNQNDHDDSSRGRKFRNDWILGGAAAANRRIVNCRAHARGSVCMQPLRTQAAVSSPMRRRKMLYWELVMMLCRRGKKFERPHCPDLEQSGWSRYWRISE